MGLETDLLQQLIFGREEAPRFTQDSPVLPSVWRAYGEDPKKPVDLLLTPHQDSTSGALARAVHLQGEELKKKEDRQLRWRLAHSDTYVVGEFTFRDLFRALLPLTDWYQRYLRNPHTKREQLRGPLIAALQLPLGSERENTEFSRGLIWLARVAGIIEAARKGITISSAPWSKETPPEGRREPAEKIVDLFLDLLEGVVLAEEEGPSLEEKKPPLWLVSINRPGHLALWRSRQTVKADVAERAFNLDFAGLRWAIIDSGIDATHPAFSRRDDSGKLKARPFVHDEGRWVNQTRVRETYDFTRLRDLLAAEEDDDGIWDSLTQEQQRAVKEVKDGLPLGRSIPWDLLKCLLQVPHTDKYKRPEGEHGTHVAGILAGDWRTQVGDGVGEGITEKHDLRGICPTLELFDLRVMDERTGGDEFSIIAALQFVRFLNSQADLPVIHGVNISISMAVDVANYACGRTPICEECERLVNNGVVTVVAAGNFGYRRKPTDRPGPVLDPRFQEISITDPGNTEGVITVGATHRIQPHTYGISYFSSRGPTADGRCKPDLVAPGEKIVAPVPGWGTRESKASSKALEGTSMAAPHVSGAAAALMARHRELIGQPARIKRILMDTATDLGREHYFQGAGLVDVFRALQSV